MKIFNICKFDSLGALIVALFFAQAFAESYSTHNVNRPYTLRMLDYAPLLNRYHDIAMGNAPQTFFYPQIDSSFRQKRDLSWYSWHSPGGRAGLSASPVLALDVRGGKHFGDTISSYEGGLFLSGYIDSVEFWLDTRIFSEQRSNASAGKWEAWDREFFDTQGDKDGLDDMEYSSYARYRGHIAMRMGWAALDFGRDAAHWGPGYYNNLALNQGSVPFNQISLSAKIGLLSVVSLHGDLDPGNHSVNKKDSRNLYGHRYELELDNLTLGLNEIAIVSDMSHHWLFIPIVPLFAEKGNYSEDNNNGAISFDFSYRFPAGLRIYSEFFLDDLESPLTLIENEYIHSKWAWMAGAELAADFGEWRAGSLAEYARVEPYVFTHFENSAAQIAHLGYPIGNQAGPNSQTVSWLAYAKHKEHFQMHLLQEWRWKGSDKGSAIDDVTPRSQDTMEKDFLKGAKMQYSLTPAVSYMSRHYAISAEYTFFDRNAFCSRIMLLW